MWGRIPFNLLRIDFKKICGIIKVENENSQKCEYHYKLGKRHTLCKANVSLFYLLKIITNVMIKAIFMIVKSIIPQNNRYIIEINPDSIIDTTSLSQS